ncbi:hypothetical protein WOLCODRAFT_63957 [Wolfiporia cocos MD-104 SS10]|uniref:Ino eighty subunit 1 n=1 Tax=Wolfiporia cocos (strain MD-104) TaxID=742152 RepID=A0A2H3JA06_WOLCO|nr:hypothetical protein WOLCODRAFT_63957 [Wolfiporia cocos MD-104 SS10]
MPATKCASSPAPSSDAHAHFCSGHTAHRKALAVKHSDGEPLTRADLQHDLLQHIFDNNVPAFTDPYTSIDGQPPRSKVTFRELYINCLLHSPRCSKASREKILEAPDFGVEFAKMSLLSNVGRINTTMAFFPEMRTALRTYHPVPSLQKTNGNLQDAPRIKNILKSCCLDEEAPGVILPPAAVLARSRSGNVPPTSIVNLIFSFSQHATVRSLITRSRAFLWLCYHYYEASSTNPFADEYANSHPEQVPELVPLTPEKAAEENVDPPDEREWGEHMTQTRKDFMAHKAREEEHDAELPADQRERARGRGRGRGGRGRARDAPEGSHASLKRERDASADSFISGAPIPHEPYPGHRYQRHPELETDTAPGSPEPQPHHPLPLPRALSPGLSPPVYSYTYPPPPRQEHLPSIPSIFAADRARNPRAHADPYPRRQRSSPESDYGGSPAAVHQPYTAYNPPRARTHELREAPPYALPHYSLDPPPHYPYYIRGTSDSPEPRPMSFAHPLPPPPPLTRPQPVPRRSMLEQAWHVVMSTDPLMDSDCEADENTRSDYVLRLNIISRLRGKSPTPEPAPRYLGPQPQLSYPALI